MKNHPHDNIYSILGKLEALTPKAEPKTETSKKIYESVDSQGSILKGLREVSSVEQRLTQQFAEINEEANTIYVQHPNDAPQKVKLTPAMKDAGKIYVQHPSGPQTKVKIPADAKKSVKKEEIEEGTCNECGMFESKCSCEPTNEGKVSHPEKGVTRHTKTDYPGYPSDDLERDEKDDNEDDNEDDKESSKDNDTGPKKGRPRKVTTKNPRRDPNAKKKARGRPKKEKIDGGKTKSSKETHSHSHDPFGRVNKSAHDRASVAESVAQVEKRLVFESNLKRILDEKHQTIDEMMAQLADDMKMFKETGHCSDLLRDCMEMHGHNKQIADESIDPANPRDYELPAFLRKQQGQAPLTMRDVMQKDKKPEHDFYQSRTGEVHPDALKIELDELAQLAGLSEVSRGEYIKQQDTAAEKSGKNEFNAFGQLFKTDQVDEDPEAEFEGNEFSGERQAAIDAGEDHFNVDGEEYPVQEGEYGDADVEEAPETKNKPKPKYASIKTITTQGDDLNRQKKQDPHTANRAANPLTNVMTLEAQLAAEYESIKKSIK